MSKEIICLELHPIESLLTGWLVILWYVDFTQWCCCFISFKTILFIVRVSYPGRNMSNMIIVRHCIKGRFVKCKFYTKQFFWTKSFTDISATYHNSEYEGCFTENVIGQFILKWSNSELLASFGCLGIRINFSLWKIL